MDSKIDYSALYQLITKVYSVPGKLLKGWSLPPLQVFIEVTYQCNLRCDFCQFIISQGPHKPEQRSIHGPEEISIAEIRQIINDIPATAVVSFTGGEPFVKKGFVDVLEYASRRNKSHIYTNGTKIDEHMAKHLAELGARNFLTPGLVLVGVSLEGLRDTHNQIAQRSWAFDKTIGGIEALIRERDRLGRTLPLVELKTVISPRNAGELYEVYLLARDLDVDIFNIMAMNLLPHASRFNKIAPPSPLMRPPSVDNVDAQLLHEQLEMIQADALSRPIQIRTTPFGFDLAEMVNYYNQGRPLHEYRCHYPWFGLGVSAYGDLSICPYAVIGNTREGRLSKLFNNATARAFRQSLAKAKLFPGCWGCCMLVPAGPRKEGISEDD